MSTENPIPTVYDDSPIVDPSVSGDSESYSVVNNLPVWLIDNIYAIHNHPWVVPYPD